MTGKYYVGVDLGGTSMLAIVMDEQGTVLKSAGRKARAELGAKGVANRIVSLIRKVLVSALLTDDDLGGVGIGIPGPVDPSTGHVFLCANLGESWTDLDLADVLQERIGVRPYIENDVNVAAVGEHTYGAARGYRDALVIFVGTGIGGGLILDNKLRAGARFGAGEVGHTTLLADGPLCSCGQRGHAEALASRRAVERYIQEAIAGGRPSIAQEILTSRNKTMMTSSVIDEAYRAGDEVTIEALRSAQHYLGLLVANCVNMFDPEIVVLGGGIIDRIGQEYVDAVALSAYQHILNKRDMEGFTIAKAALGDLSGAIGAATLAATHSSYGSVSS